MPQQKRVVLFARIPVELKSRLDNFVEQEETSQAKALEGILSNFFEDKADDKNTIPAGSVS